MNRHIQSVFFILLGLFFLFGCHKKDPEPVTYESGTYWDVLAEDVAMQIKLNLEKLNALTRIVYVEPACGAPRSPCEPHNESAFGEGFRDLLMTHLVRHGITTIDEIEEDALVVTSKAQLVWQKDNSKVVVTTSIKEYNTYLVRKSDVYHINNADYWHYKMPPPVHVIEVHDS